VRLQVSANSAPPVRGFLIMSGGSLGDIVALFRAGTFTGGTTLCADLGSSQQWLLLYSCRLPHLPAMDMATAIIIGAMSKTIGMIASIGMLRSAVVGGVVVGGATAKALAGGGLRAATSGFAAKALQSKMEGRRLRSAPFIFCQDCFQG
jgi:hypothetical protein